jgi:hypothetical protein
MHRHRAGSRRGRLETNRERRSRSRRPESGGLGAGSSRQARRLRRPNRRRAARLAPSGSCLVGRRCTRCCPALELKRCLRRPTQRWPVCARRSQTAWRLPADRTVRDCLPGRSLQASEERPLGPEVRSVRGRAARAPSIPSATGTGGHRRLLAGRPHCDLRQEGSCRPVRPHRPVDDPLALRLGSDGRAAGLSGGARPRTHHGGRSGRPVPRDRHDVRKDADADLQHDGQVRREGGHAHPSGSGRDPSPQRRRSDVGVRDRREGSARASRGPRGARTDSSDVDSFRRDPAFCRSRAARGPEGRRADRRSRR